MKLTVDDQPVYLATGNREIDPQKPSVVFIHGTGQDHTIWVLPTRYFARHQRNVLAVDLPGHGRSGGDPLASIEAMAAWIVKVMDAAGIESAAMVGHSMGSLVALVLAAKYADRARNIALIGTAVPMPVSEPLLKSAKQNSPDAIEMLNLWGFGASAHLGGNATPGMWMLGGGKRLMERAAPGVIYTDLNACNQYLDGPQDAGSVACHALLILGQKDMMTPPRAARTLADALPDSETVVLEKSGHAMLSERPEQVLDQLIRIV
jgi:pimeloyl-ACP methyl ester carboxylesterase